MLGRTKQVPSAEREALRVAIATNTERRAQIAAAQTALSQATDAARSASAAWTQAVADAEAADAANAEYAIALARGTAGEKPLAPSEARAAVVGAEEAMQAAQRARTALQAAYDDITRYSRLPAERVDATAAAVLRADPATEAMLTRFDAVAAEFMALGHAVEFLISARVLERPAAYREVTPDIARASRLDRPPIAWAGWQDREAQREHYGRWFAALEALKADADAKVQV